MANSASRWIPSNRLTPVLAAFTLICGLFASQSSLAVQGDTLNLSNRIGTVEDRSIFDNPGWNVWGGSAIRGDDGRYHMFYSRWKGPFGNWKKGSEIAYAVSDDARGPYKFVRTVLQGSGDPGRWDYYNAHNPHVKKFGDTYYLYYIATQPSEDAVTARELLDNQSIGVVTFKDFGQVERGEIHPPAANIMQPDHEDTFRRTVNPSVTRGHDGAYYMAFKSTAEAGGFVHWIARSEEPDHPFTLAGKMLDHDLGAEDPYLWYDARRKKYYAIVKEFGKGKLAPQHGALALITSTNALDWSPALHPLVTLREIKRPDGKTYKVRFTDRPQLVFGEDGEITTLSVASAGLPGWNHTYNVQIPITPTDDNAN